MKIDTDFAGGNLLVDSVDGNIFSVRQDIRDTSEWWFWWAFRLTGQPGETATFRFGNGDVFTSEGPCASWDSGQSWEWLGRPSDPMTEFSVTLRRDASTVLLAMAPLYTERNLSAFLATRPAIERHRCCLSEKGREIAQLVVPGTSPHPRTVIITARTHACETPGSFALEGLLDWWAYDGADDATWARREYSLHALPFVDTDGVEQGDQGKLREPHDHNRDFGDAPIYSSVRAIQALVADAGDTLDAYIDLHAPWIRYASNETMFTVGVPEPWQSESDKFAKLLEKSNESGVPFRHSDIIPLGIEWNQYTPTISAIWVAEHSSARLSTIIELAYARARETTLSPALLRSFGREIGAALARYLRGSGGDGG
ncbi:MAG TPA: hypothetical protein VGK19_11430 [Capsulimonadaceae bacterium]|jgi:hypothetical protein